MLGIILGIITFIVVMYLDVQSDFKRLDTNTINHKRGTWLRILGLIPVFGCFYFPLESLTFGHIILKVFVVAGLLFSWWWEFFDGWLNLKRGKSWRYNGSDDINDAKTDNFLQKYASKQQTFIKWGLILIFTLSYCFLQ